MKWTEIEQNWAAMIPSIQARWPEVSEADLTSLSGKRDELVAVIADATGDTPNEAGRQVAEWMEGPMPSDAFAHPTHDNAAARDARRYVPPGEDPLSDDARFGDEDQPEPPMGRDR